jgi:predicted acylesterase/phospholipase RssA
VDQSEACERLRTYQSSAAGPGASCTIWEACRATSAASLYFPSITINGRTYWDGGMNSNNPILQVIEEAKSEFGDGRAFQAIVSIGTGKGPIADPSSHVLGVVNYAIKRMADTQQKHTEFVSRYPDLQEQYFRFNEENELYKIDLADWKKLGEVERLANEYIASVAGRKLINSCARKLARGASNT